MLVCVHALASPCTGWRKAPGTQAHHPGPVDKDVPWHGVVLDEDESSVGPGLLAVGLVEHLPAGRKMPFSDSALALAAGRVEMCTTPDDGTCPDLAIVALVGRRKPGLVLQGAEAVATTEVWSAANDKDPWFDVVGTTVVAGTTRGSKLGVPMGVKAHGW